MTIGFRCWNNFEHEILLLRQLYDFTADLYARENSALASQLTERGPGRSMHTTLGTVTHNVNSLYEYTKKRFPTKLRELLLISSITYLEGFLVELILEIAERTLEPFRTQSPFEVPKAQALSYPSIAALREDILRRETRQLTSGGLKDFAKYFQSKFDIRFSNIGVSYDDVLEVHERRHLYVHRDGVCDAQFAQRYPSLGYKPGSKVPIDQTYLIASLSLLKEFGAAVKEAALRRYPVNLRRMRTVSGGLVGPRLVNPPLLIKLELSIAGFDAITEIPKIQVRLRRVPPIPLHDLTYNIILEEDIVTLIVAGTEMQIRAVMHALKSRKEFRVRSVGRVLA